MKFPTAALIGALALILAAPTPAQFGGILRRAKEKVDRTREKAKPATDRAQRGLDTFQPWRPEEEQQIGEATAAKMIAMFGLVEDPKLAQYVNLVGLAVAQYAPRQLPYRFGILNTNIINAFALPGGFVLITRGALETMNNEAELAGALAHEVLHIAERHLEQAIRSKQSTAWAVQEGGQAVRLSDSEITKRADLFVRDMLNMRLSRDKEDAADEQGSTMAAQAGYAPGGLLDFLKLLAAGSQKAENQQFFGQLLSTHPPFEDRIAHLEPLVAKMGRGGQTLEARFRAAFAQ